MEDVSALESQKWWTHPWCIWLLKNWFQNKFVLITFLYKKPNFTYTDLANVGGFLSVISHSYDTFFMANYPRISQESRTMCSSRYLQPKEQFVSTSFQHGNAAIDVKYKISEAAIPSTSMFCVSHHWAQCPQPDKAEQKTKTERAYLWTYAVASKNKTSLLRDAALFLERAMSLIYINHCLNSSGLLYIKPLQLM